ncbi:MAG: ISL3 family transposase [Erysipelotrichaceae bacterium]
MSIFKDPCSLSDAHILQLFNLQRENVESINISHKPDGLYANIKLVKKPHVCPICEFETSTVKDYTTKKIIHSLTTNTPCFINYKARRYKCPICSKTFYEHNPFSYKNMKISSLTVYNVLNDLKKATETFKTVSDRHHISPTTAAAIFDAHVSISRKLLPRYLCIDEVYAFQSVDSNYVCVFVDYTTGSTIDLFPSRKKVELGKYLSFIPLEERKKVEIVSIDMWDTYRILAKDYFPSSVVSVDKFHLLQEMHKQIDKIRIKIMSRIKPSKVKDMKSLSIQEKEEYKRKDNQYYLLKKFHWLLFKNAENMNKKVEGKIVNLLDPNYEKLYNKKLMRYLNLYDIQGLMLDINDDLTKAINLKYKMDQFYKNCTFEKAKKELGELIIEFRTSGLTEMISFSNTLTRWKKEVINSFIIVDKENNKKINNGIIENRNKVIKQLKHNSNGYKRWERFRNRALYVLNDDATFRLNPTMKKDDFR